MLSALFLGLLGANLSELIHLTLSAEFLFFFSFNSCKALESAFNVECGSGVLLDVFTSRPVETKTELVANM